MGTTKLDVYNAALRHLGEPPLVALTDDYASRYELDRVYAEALTYMLRQGAWRFATKTTYLYPQTTPSYLIPGYTKQYLFPSDWLYTHSLFQQAETSREVPFDVREERQFFLSNEPAMLLRYVSNAFVDESYWTDPFTETVAAYLAWKTAYRITSGMPNDQMIEAKFKTFLTTALQFDAVPSSLWLRHQLSGQFIKSVHYVLEHGLWRFAVKSADLVPNGVPATGFGYRYDLPVDWVRTINVTSTGYTQNIPVLPGQMASVPFREEARRSLMVDYPLVTLTYLSQIGYDARFWPEQFSDTVLEHCQLTEGKDSPSALAVFAAKLKDAEFRDNYRDRVRVNNVGRVVRGRWGNSDLSREQGWGPWAS